MSTVHEAYIGLEFLTAKLTGDAPVMSKALGGIRRGAAPVGILMPVGIIQFISGIDVNTMNARRLMVNAVYLVKSVGSASNTSAVASLAAAIDDALGGDQGLRNVNVPGGFVLGVYRESFLQFDEDVGSIKYSHFGGIYRLRAQQKP